LLSSRHSPAIEGLSHSSERHRQTSNNRATCKSRQQYPTDFLKFWICIHTRQSGLFHCDTYLITETLGALASQTSLFWHSVSFADPSSATALELTFQLDHRLRAGHHPLLTQKVIAGIHWEALRLWSKRLKVRSRPGGR